MKRALSLILIVTLTISSLSGCSVKGDGSSSQLDVSSDTSKTNIAENEGPNESSEVESESILGSDISTGQKSDTDSSSTKDSVAFDWEEDIKFTGMSDENLQTYIEDSVYSQLVAELDSTEYFVENVSATYLSQEYLQELAYNSQTNVFFGYSLSALDEFFQGTRYVFTLGEDGQTTVEPLQIVEDSTYDQMLKNVAVGTGVILVCVTVSVVSAGAGAPAVSMIFAVAAKTGAICALSGATISGVTSAVVKGYQTGDLNEALKAGALGASEGYKWGAISGALTGGAGEAWGLYSATGNGLTMNQVAAIQQESGYPLSLIRQFHSVEEYTIFRDAGLQAEFLGGNLTLVRSDIDLYNVVDEYGRNNFTRMSNGLNPIDGSGRPFEWHHIGQENDATLSLLTSVEHDNGALHGFKVISEIDRAAFSEYKKTLNKALLKWLLSIA